MPEAVIDKPDIEEDEPAVEVEEPKRSRRQASKSKVEEQAQDSAEAKLRRAEENREREVEEARKQLEALDPQTKPMRWTVGKPPEYGGTEKQYSVYVQDKLPWMPRQQFFALVSRTFAQAIKSGGGGGESLGDLLGGSGSLIERGRALTQRDLTDASQFMALAFDLIGHSPSFLVDCYLILLDVPIDERRWAQARFAEPWDPERDRWGLKDDDHEQIIQTFIDQNYEEIRRFFVVTLPKMGKRVSLHERGRKRTTDQDSASEQSK